MRKTHTAGSVRIYNHSGDDILLYVTSPAVIHSNRTLYAAILEYATERGRILYEYSKYNYS